MADQFLRIERSNGVLKITLDDPKTRNALGPEMVGGLVEELDRFEQNPDDRVLLLTGQDPSFCSGANIRRFDERIQESKPDQQKDHPVGVLPWAKMDALLGEQRKADPNSGALLPLRIHELQKPSIVAVNGFAIGVGMGLTLACDIRLASERAVFSEAFVHMGLIPGDGSCWQLPRLIGLSHTLLLQYTGDRIDAAEAHRIGLVSKVYSHDNLTQASFELAQRIAQGPTVSLSLTKYLVQKSLDMGLRESLDLANAAQELARLSEDHQEAVQAFLEKRKPQFKGQ